ncbi:MAG: PEGA domain-containing protein [Spirochaetota bacterium]|nr:PEGA domain-containing protein [Spirochaetota bacterium]
MLKQLFFLLLLLIIFSYSSIAQTKKTVAVLNFTNYGGEGLKYLSNAVPESISTSLVELKEINVVERTQIKKLLNELELEQTGLIDIGNASRIGKMARADILIIGSISGDPENLIVSLKAVDITSSNLITARIIKTSLANLFNLANQAVRTMGAVITGQEMGTISVSTNPTGAEIYIDGLVIGKSPIIESKITVGEHRVKAVKKGYLDYDEIVNISLESHEKLNPILREDNIKDRTEIGFGIMTIYTFHNDIDLCPFFYLFIGHTFSHISIAGEIGFASPKHNMTLTSPTGSTFIQERWYEMFFCQASINYIPSFSWRYILPYTGILFGIVHIEDYRKNHLFDENEEELYDKTVTSLGVKLGASFLPSSILSMFVESRYAYCPQRIIRYEYQSQGVTGDMKKVKRKYTLSQFSFGAGIKVFF